MNTASFFRSGLAVCVLVLAAAGGARAQAPAATPQAANAKVSGKEYVLTHTSSFQAPPNGQRNPFWPIGWVPSAGLPSATVAAVYDVKAEQFVVTSVSVDYPALAVINGKTHGVGDHIPVSADNKEFVLVKQILDGQVVLDYHGREMRSFSGGLPVHKP